jgi:hypothetical protein
MQPTSSPRRHQGMLPMNTVFHVGDAIVSDNGLYFATLRADGTLAVFRGIDETDPVAVLWSSGRNGATGQYFALVQNDGNFCIYRGTGLDQVEGWHWGSQMTAKGSSFYGAMQDDGNFSIRKGHGPDDSCGLIWATGATDRVESIVEVLHIEYDLDAACVLRTSPANVYNEAVGHDDAPASVCGTVSVTTTTAWTNDIPARYSADAHFRAPVPVMDSEAIVMSCESLCFLPNTAHTASRSWRFDTPAPAGPARASVHVTYSTISVPYVLLAALRFESGVRVIGPLKGAFMGTNAHDLKASFAAAGKSRAIERRLPIIPIA